MKIRPGDGDPAEFDEFVLLVANALHFVAAEESVICNGTNTSSYVTEVPDPTAIRVVVEQPRDEDDETDAIGTRYPVAEYEISVRKIERKKPSGG